MLYVILAIVLLFMFKFAGAVLAVVFGLWTGNYFLAVIGLIFLASIVALFIFLDTEEEDEKKPSPIWYGY